MEPADKRSSGCEDETRTVVSWRMISESGSGGGRVIIVDAKIFWKNKQTVNHGSLQTVQTAHSDQTLVILL